LRTEADAESWPPGIEARTQTGDFLHQERISVRFVHADRSAQYDEQIGLQQRFLAEWVDACFDILQIDPSPGKNRRKEPRILERNMANGEATCHFQSSAFNSPGRA
jgi:hypothetical protein